MLDQKNSNQPPFVFTQTSAAFLKSRKDSDFSVDHAKKSHKSAFRNRGLSLGVERNFINENIGKIQEYDFMSALKNGKKINGVLN